MFWTGEENCRDQQNFKLMLVLTTKGQGPGFIMFQAVFNGLLLLSVPNMHAWVIISSVAHVILPVLDSEGWCSMPMLAVKSTEPHELMLIPGLQGHFLQLGCNALVKHTNDGPVYSSTLQRGGRWAYLFSVDEFTRLCRT